MFILWLLKSQNTFSEILMGELTKEHGLPAWNTKKCWINKISTLFNPTEPYRSKRTPQRPKRTCAVAVKTWSGGWGKAGSASSQPWGTGVQCLCGKETEKRQKAPPRKNFSPTQVDSKESLAYLLVPNTKKKGSIFCACLQNVSLSLESF